MKTTIAILGIFVAIFCSLQSPIAACDIEVVYNQAVELCDTFSFFNFDFCERFSYDISNEKLVELLESEKASVCKAPLFSTICAVCDFSSIISNNQNVTINGTNPAGNA
ncbi:uncharacterized protein LOC108095288 [Drosophila ficusphila]|uniref:uncharacterized protein LOC108095288 n=1 Tax=Drosophila ficusphila TaxID=30025 RepID=UPI0007E7707C|nr:uncharacterized protein LOC108095288 [Drosophila ficusphila]